MNRVLSLLPFLLLLAAVGCADEEIETQPHGLAQPGFWAPPADVLALADTFTIQNVQAGPWVGTSGCGGSFLEGTAVLRQWLYDHWPQTTSIGGYSCRPIANSSSMSVHATGRALDIMLPVDRTANGYNNSADNDIGDPIANWLLANAQELGVQLIIWDNMIWSSGRSPGSRLSVYTNTNKHVDHIHVELNPDGAAMRTPWFNGPMGPPDLGPCGDPIGPEGGIVDDADACFNAFGPAQYWRQVSGQGHGGGLKWTNAFSSENPSNWARWNLDFAEAGTYELQYHSVREFAVFNSANYRIRANGVETDVYVDLSAGEDGWQTLGSFDFAAGRDQWVSLFDNTPGAVGSDQHIIADAIRVVPPAVEPEPEPEPEPQPEPEPEPEPEPQPELPEQPIGGPPEGDGGEMPDGGDGMDGLVEAKGGCGCATTSATSDASTLLGLFGLLALGARRRR